MTSFIRSFLFAMFFASLLVVVGCGKSDDAAPQAATGTVAGTYSPLNTLTAVVATPVGGGTTYTATLSPAGSYSFKLPAGTYNIVYTAATGYVSPPTQTATSTVDNTLQLPALTLTSQRFSLLTTPKWRIMARTSATTQNGTKVTQDLFLLYTSCQRQELHKFNANKNYTVEYPCSPGSPPVLADTWDFASNETQFLFGTSSSTVYTIRQLTTTTLDLLFARTINGILYEDVAVYTAVP